MQLESCSGHLIKKSLPSGPFNSFEPRFPTHQKLRLHEYLEVPQKVRRQRETSAVPLTASSALLLPELGCQRQAGSLPNSWQKGEIQAGPPLRTTLHARYQFIDDAIENDPRRNRYLKLKSGSRQYGTSHTSREHTGRRRHVGHVQAHDRRLCAAPPPTSTPASSIPRRTPPANLPLQVLAVDLLNPSPQHEARQHKLKVYPTNTPTSPP